METQLRMVKLKADTLKEHSLMLEGSLRTLSQLKGVMETHYAKTE